MKNKKLIRIVTAALFASLVTGLTVIPKIPIPGGGYVHLGDTMIYIAATFLPMPYAMTAAAIGGCLADIFSGYSVYAPFSITAKILLTIAFSHTNNKILTKRNCLAPLSGIVITPLIYFFADAFFAKSFAAAVPGIFWNLAQAAASMIAFYTVATAFDKMQLKSKFQTKI